MTMLKESLHDSETKRKAISMLLAQADSFSVQIDDELHVAIGTQSVADLKKLADDKLNRGSTVRWADHTTQWIETREIVDLSKEASERFIWDEAGERVQCERFLMTMDEHGETSRKFIRKVWRSFQ